MSKIHPNLVLEELLAKTYRPERKKALQSIHALCEAQSAGTAKDMRVSTIGALAEKLGILSRKTLSNPQSAPLVDLIKAWEGYVGGDTPPQDLGRSVIFEKLLTIPDLALRVLIQSRLAERDKLLAQVNLLKGASDLFIDRRSSSPATGIAGANGATLLRLRDSELTALRVVLAPKFLEGEGWVEGSHGEVVDGETRRQVFPKGFLTALRRVCGELNEK